MKRFMRLIARRVLVLLVWLPIGGLGVVSAEPPEISISRKGTNAIEISVVGGVVESGWVLQDSYNGADWRDLATMDGGPGQYPISSTSTPTRLFRAAKKPLATRQEALTEARARWEAIGLVNYQFRSQTSVSGFLTDDLTLVENGQVREATSLLPPGFPNFSWGDQTIDDLFDRLQRAIDADAFMMSVSYHPERGYPESAYVDLDDRIADEEWGITITEAPTAPEELRLKNRNLWERAGPDAYEFDLRYESAWIFWEGRIRVTGGTAQVVAGQVPLGEQIIMTMDEYLAYLGAGVAGGNVTSALYDSELGYPLFFSRDWYLTISDGPGERFWISGFQVVEGD